jgi:predicted DNA-binding transcriptional regulator AlpA
MKMIRFGDLVSMGIVKNRMTLKRLINTQGFPPGFLISARSRAWDETDVNAWVAKRPTTRVQSHGLASA